jgi:iron(III) transport system substrate-binding protein
MVSAWHGTGGIGYAHATATRRRCFADPASAASHGVHHGTGRRFPTALARKAVSRYLPSVAPCARRARIEQSLEVVMHPGSRLAALAAALSFGLAALAPVAAVAAEVVLYSSNNVDAIKVVTDLFGRKYPDIKISTVRAGTGALMQRMKAEAGNPGGDIVWSGGVATLGAYRDLFAPYKSPEAAAVPPAYRGPDDLWLGVNYHLMIIMINEKALKGAAPPKSWAELFDPKWKGRIIVADPERSGTAYAALYGINEVHGKDGLARLAQNVTVTPSSSVVYESVAKGEFAVGITLETAAYEYVAGGMKDVRIIYPAEGAVLLAEGMVIIKGAKHLAEAQKLYDFLASREAQEALFKAAYRRPIRQDVDVTRLSSLPAISAVKTIAIDEAKAAAAQPAFLAGWKALVK